MFRFVDRGFHRTADDIPRFGNVPQFPQRHRLHQRVSHGGAFRGACDHAAIKHIRCHLAEQRVPDAAARDAAMGGWAALSKHIKGLSAQDRAALEPASYELKKAAKAADAKGKQ